MKQTMFKMLVLSFLLVISFAIKAKSKNKLYQIDLIVFKHEASVNNANQLQTTLSYLKNRRNLEEQSSSLSPYHLLPFSFTHLKEEFWALRRKPQYQVLLNYSWLQPVTNNVAFYLPKTEKEGWYLEGNIKVQQQNYYSLSSELLISKPDGSSFIFKEQQRLKGGQIYYFDNPEIGMLIKVHQIA